MQTQTGLPTVQDDPLRLVKSKFEPVLKKFGKLVEKCDVLYSGKQDTFILQLRLFTGQEHNYTFHMKKGFL